MVTNIIPLQKCNPKKRERERERERERGGEEITVMTIPSYCGKPLMT